jgi:pyruvate kinase
MFTTLGPQLLVGRIQNKEVKLIKDSYLVITTNYDLIGNENIISCNYNKLCESAQVGGELIFVNDIDIYCQITDINKNEDRIKVKIVNSGILKENSIIYLPFADIKIPTITSEDEEAIIKFVLKEGFDMIVVSFVRSFTDLEDTRDILGPRGTHIKIIAKIDNYLGIKNYEEILNHSDGIMIARGRLCYEMPEEKLIQFQKYMIVKAKLAGKPVITSTQMLDSMVDNSRPTLAEVTDVANAVLEGSDAVLLTHETSIGKYPLESFKMMVKVLHTINFRYVWKQSNAFIIKNHSNYLELLF